MTGPRTPRSAYAARSRQNEPAPEVLQQDASLAPLLRAAALGDEKAWRDLVGLYAHRVYALARSRRLSEEAAEEITQSVFATLAERMGSGDYVEQGKFEPWLFRITINRIRDDARRARRHAEPTDPASFSAIASSGAGSAEPHLATPGRLGAVSPELAALRDALDRLGESDREIIELRHHAGLSFRQISDLLAEPLGTVLARHHRALRKMREILEPDRRLSHGDSA